MKSTIVKFDPSFVVVDSKLQATDIFQYWMLQVTERGLLIGTGSPENVVEAQQGVEYMDETGVAGSVKYIKQLADISGDKKRGWVAIG